MKINVISKSLGLVLMFIFIVLVGCPMETDMDMDPSVPIDPPAPIDDPTAPSAPAAPMLTFGDGELTALWDAPSDNGNAEITGYHLQHSVSEADNWTLLDSNVIGTSHTIDELENGVSYDVQVRAVNSVGNGMWSKSATASPVADSGSSVHAFIVYDDSYNSVIDTENDFPSWGSGLTLAEETSTVKTGSSSLSFEWTAPGSGTEFPVKTGMEQDLTIYTALTFWARAAGNADLAVTKIGFESGTAYEISLSPLTVTSSWQKFVLPIPDPAKLTAASKLFFASSDGGGKIYVDDVKFEKISGLSLTEANMAIGSIGAGDTGKPEVSGLVFTYNGERISQFSPGGVAAVTAFLPYASAFASDNTDVATVAADGTVTGVAEGTATITAKLGDYDLSSAVTITAATAAPEPFAGTIYDDALQGGFTAATASANNNNVAIDPASATEKVGSSGTSVEIDVPEAQGWGGGFLENTAGVDASGFTSFKFAFNTGTLTSPGFIEFKLEDTDGGSYTPNLFTLTGTAISGSTGWEEYSVTLTDISAVNFSKFKAVGFWHPETTADGSDTMILPGEFYIDNIRFE